MSEEKGEFELEHWRSRALVAERERRKAEAEIVAPPPSSLSARLWARVGFAEVVAVLALAAAIVAWFRH